MVVAEKLSWPYGKVTPAGGGTCGLAELNDVSVVPGGAVNVTCPPGVLMVIELPPGCGDAFHWTLLSVDVEAVLGLAPPSSATPAGTVAITVPDCCMPLTDTVYVVGPPDTTAALAPAVPLSVTSPVAKPTTG